MEKQDFKKYIIALAIFYLLQWFAPNKPVYFASYIVLIFLFFLASGSIIRSLLYSFILSIFSETSIAASLFRLDPDIGSGYFISPFTIVASFLLIASFIYKIRSKIHWVDVIPLMFLLWNVILFFLYPHPNSLFGIFTLGEMTIAYYFIRNFLKRRDLAYIPLLFSSMLIFQSIIALIQFIIHGNVGILVETTNIDFPYGLTAPEEEELFRSSGATYHANTLSMLLIIFIPYLFYYGSYLVTFLKFIWAFVLFTTYSRIAWFIGAVQFLYLNIWHFKTLVRMKINFSILSLLLTTFFLIYPLLLVRLDTIPEALSEQGSWGVRVKTYLEAWNLIKQNPLSGVGANMSLAYIIENPETDLYQHSGVSVFKKIHNFFLEIAAENGIVGFLLMIIFLIGVLKRTDSSKHKVILYSKLALISFLTFVQFHPLFLTPQMRLVYLLSAIIMTR